MNSTSQLASDIVQMIFVFFITLLHIVKYSANLAKIGDFMEKYLSLSCIQIPKPDHVNSD